MILVATGNKLGVRVSKGSAAPQSRKTGVTGPYHVATDHQCAVAQERGESAPVESGNGSVQHQQSLQVGNCKPCGNLMVGECNITCHTCNTTSIGVVSPAELTFVWCRLHTALVPLSTLTCQHPFNYLVPVLVLNIFNIIVATVKNVKKAVNSLTIPLQLFLSK